MGLWLSDERTKARRDRINMIGKSIQTRLFSAVFLVIFMMTFGVGITLFLSSRWYVQYTAKKETEHLIRMVQSESDRLSTDPAYTSSDSKENTRESSKALLRSVRAAAQRSAL